MEAGERTGRLVVLSGPAGVGKDTVLARWTEMNPAVVRVVAYTTRDPRPGEQEGIDYHFVEMEEFRQMARLGHFLEYKEYGGNFYATPLLHMNHLLEDGKIAVLKIEVKGAMEVRKLRPDALLVMLQPPSMEVLEQRIRERNTENPEVQQRRLEIAKEELTYAKDYDHVVINDDLDPCVECLEALIR